MATQLVAMEQAFDVVGIAVRTSNSAEAQGKGVIQNLWQRFFVEQIAAQIPNKIDNDIIALYCDYDSDSTGEYTLLIGVHVASADHIPAGMVHKHVAQEKRTTFVTETGVMGKVVFDAWQKIWTQEANGNLNRAYGVDYELYTERCQDPNNAQVEIHIGIK